MTFHSDAVNQARLAAIEECAALAEAQSFPFGEDYMSALGIAQAIRALKSSPTGIPTIRRYEFCAGPYFGMSADDLGAWVKYEDVAALLNAAPLPEVDATVMGRAQYALKLIREIDASGVLFKHNMDLDAKVANFMHELEHPSTLDVPALLSALEREFVLKAVRDVRATVAGRESPYAAGFDMACEEITHRLEEAWLPSPQKPTFWCTDVARFGSGDCTKQCDNCRDHVNPKWGSV